MSHNEGIPEEENLDVPMMKTKLEEEKKEVNEDDVFDEPIDKPTVGQVKKKHDIPYFLNKIEIPKLKTNNLIEKGDKDELEREYNTLYQK